MAKGQHVEEIAAAVTVAITALEERSRARDADEKAKAAERESLSNRVSVATLALTMLLSFLGFARSERDDAAKELKRIAHRAHDDAADDWRLYQNRAGERATYILGQDQVAREAALLSPAAPRFRQAALDQAAYATRVTQLDNENRHVFFLIERLEAKEAHAKRLAAHIEQKLERYDLGTRVLTLALIVLSVTLLANRPSLFWLGVAVAFAGAGLTASGWWS